METDENFSFPDESPTSCPCLCHAFTFRRDENDEMTQHSCYSMRTEIEERRSRQSLFDREKYNEWTHIERDGGGHVHMQTRTTTNTRNRLLITPIR